MVYYIRYGCIMRLSETIYRLLLRAYPRGYRDQYGQVMEQLFRDQLRGARTFVQRSALWMRTLLDWSKTVVTRHFDPPTAPMARPIPAESFKRCLYFALAETRAYAQPEITLDHLLLGILREEPSLVSDGGRDAMMRALHSAQQKGYAPTDTDLPLSHETKRVWIAAAIFANDAGRKKIAPRDLAAGILRESHTRAAQLLREHLR
jgi:hypothetical protein